MCQKLPSECTRIQSRFVDSEGEFGREAAETLSLKQIDADQHDRFAARVLCPVLDVRGFYNHTSRFVHSIWSTFKVLSQRAGKYVGECRSLRVDCEMRQRRRDRA